MTSIRFDQASFGSGELSPRLLGRVDFARYYSGLQTLSNMLVMPQGSIVRRPGWRFISKTKSTEDGDDPITSSRLIPFVFNNEQSYVLEIGTSKIRFFLPDGTRLEDGGSPVELDAPWGSAQIFALDFTQSADLLYIFGGGNSVKPKVITRTSPTTFTIEDWFPTDGPFLAENLDDTFTLTPSGSSGSITVTASSSLFASTDVDRLIRLHGGTEWGWVQITGFTSDTQVSADVIQELENSSVTARWALGAWSDTTGYPSVGTFHDNRLFAAATTSRLFTLWGSRSSDFDSFQPTELDDTTTASHSLSVNFVAGKVHEIRWLEGMDQGLVVGTSDGEGLLRAAADTQALGPDNLQSIFPSSRGSEVNTRSVRIDKSALFIQRGGLTVREFFLEGFDDFASADLGALAEHLFQESKLEELIYQQSPNSIVWARLADGTLLSFTFERAQEVAAWATHPTDGQVLSLAVIPGDDGEDQLWATIRRPIEGPGDQVFVEKLDPVWVGTDDLTDAFGADAGITFTADPATSVITGLDHLEGETVSVFGSGGTVGTGRIFGSGDGLVVSSGQVDISTVESGLDLTKAQVGLFFTAQAKSMSLERPEAQTRARQRKATHAHLHFLSTRLGGGGTTIKVEGHDAQTIRDPLLDPFDLRTGVVTVPLQSGYEPRTVLELSVTDPTPFHLLGWTVDVDIGGS